MIWKQVQQLVADALQINPEEISEKTRFRDDLGADSLEVFQIVMAVEQCFDIVLEQSMADVKLRTVGELCEKVKETMGAGGQNEF